MASNSSFRGQVIDEKEADERFTCGICCCYLVNPCRPNVCQHIFCKECLYNSSVQSNQCPMCRKCYSFSKVVYESQVENEISNTAIKCEFCRQNVKVQNMQRHRNVCNEYVTPKKEVAGKSNAGRIDRAYGASSLTTASASAACDSDSWSYQSRSSAYDHNSTSKLRSIVAGLAKTSVSRPTAPNRYTFRCPYCHADNLTLDTLRDHCNQYHANGAKNMVCPVCTAMPWGDPNLKSIDFITHLNYRHKFEYDKYVDFTLDDEEALSQAMRNSLKVM